ncbi:MAG: small nuclear ribonucleoprotein (snRNP)-like protein [Cognaticolwellia sp.]|jgi:small nuclear ribonucleoprotein (snRNP)-like protein
MLFTLLLACFSDRAPDAFPLRTTLQDGQVLVGAIQTPVLELKGGLGVLRIPLEDVGEIAPVEGGALAGSGNHVTVWLRNGSELQGQWAAPELALRVSAGGEQIPVELPVDELLRVQTNGPQAWPEYEIVRVKTTHGDDFLVDPAATQIAVNSSLGTFAPFLTECKSMRPIDGDATGDWRVELNNGSVLIGPLAKDSMTLKLTMGPDTVDVPLDVLQSIERQDWADNQMPMEDNLMQSSEMGGRWFSNDSIQQRKLMY